MSQSSYSAFAPSHITAFFQIFENGSTGAGVNTALGVVSRVALAEETSIRINGELVAAPVSQAVLQAYAEALGESRLSIEHEVSYPVGYGMGMSGAGAFSLSLALNELLQKELNVELLSYKDCMELAVRAEIQSGTGLGDVVAQQFGGIMIGLPPYPSRDVEILESACTHVVTAFFEPLETKKIIRNPELKERINSIGAECMQELQKDKTLERLMELARFFSLETGLASEQVRAVMEALPTASMAMLGQTAFVLTSEPEQIEQELRKFTSRVLSAGIAKTGARVL